MYNINERLSELKSGNYLIKVTSIGDKRPNKYYSKEYFVTVKYQVTDLNNPKRKYGVVVPGLGAKPIELNEERELLPTNYFTWQNFDEVLFERLARWQNSINQDGYYPKDRDTGQIVVKDNNLKREQKCLN